MRLVVMDAVFGIDRKEKPNGNPQDKEDKRDRQRRLKGELHFSETDQDKNKKERTVKADLLSGRRKGERVQEDDDSHEDRNRQMQTLEEDIPSILRVWRIHQ